MIGLCGSDSFSTSLDLRGRICEEHVIEPRKTIFQACLVVLTASGLQTTAAAPLPPASPNTPNRATNQPIVYSICDGRVEIKPRLKFELFLSLHVLRTAEDHHQLFIPWAERMRASLAPETLRQATNLNALVHEWQLCSLVQDYDGPDTIEGITNYLARDAKKTTARWAGQQGRGRCRQVFGVGPDQVGAWLAGFLSRYYAEGFGKEWPEQRRLIEQQAAADVRTFERLPFSIAEFLEKHTGRKFQGPTRIIFYPSSFSRPQHAYGFSEQDNKVVVYMVGDSPVGTALHELLHPLLRGWNGQNRMQKVVADLGREPLFKADVSKIRGSYGYPDGCLEELLVHSISNYLCVKAGAGSYSEAKARRQTYGAYENALYDAIFDRYDSFPVIDDFIYYALTHIRKTADSGKRQFSYEREAPAQPEKALPGRGQSDASESPESARSAMLGRAGV